MVAPHIFEPTTELEVPLTFSVLDVLSHCEQGGNVRPIGDWQFALPDPNQPNPPRYKWVYVFHSSPNGDVQLYAEYYCDADGLLSFCDGPNRRITERTGPEPEATNQDETRLPSKINGATTVYFLYVSWVRLPLAALHEFETGNHAFLFGPLAIPCVHLQNQSATANTYENDYVVAYPRTSGNATNVGYLLGAVDPLAVAKRLALEYIDACDAVIDYTIASSDSSAPEPRRATRRHEKLLLARVLRSILDSDIDDRLAIANNFADGSGQIVRQYIEQWESMLARLVAKRELRAIKLAMYLESDLFRFAESLYRTSQADELADYHLFLQLVGTAHQRLSESNNGRILLGKLTGNHPYWLSTYVLPEAALTDPQFQVSRKSATALVEVWEELSKALIADAPDRVEQTLVTLDTKIEHVTRQKLFVRQRGIKTVRYKSTTRYVTTSVTLFSVEAVAEDVLQGRLEQWLPSNTAVNTVLQRLHRCFEIINLASAASALLREPDPDTSFNLVGSCLDTIGAFAPLLRLTQVAKDRVGRASAVIDIYQAGKEGTIAYDQNNYGALTGQALVAAGSTAGFIGTLSAIEVLGLSLTGWGAIVVGVGWVVTAFLADSDLEVFVGHCCFGRHYGQGDTRPTWATTPLNAWRGNGAERFDEQLKSLFNIISAFSIAAKTNNRARFRYGFVTPRSVFRIRAQVIGKHRATRSFELAVNVAERSVTHESGDLPDLSSNLRQFSSETDAAGNWFEIVFNIPKTSLPEPEREAFDAPSARLQVQLDIFGDSSFNHPRSFLSYDLQLPTGNEGAEGAPGIDNASSGDGSNPINSKNYL